MRRAARVLVACDFDGTLAPIVAHPDQAAPLPGVVGQLAALARRRDIRVAVVSGRALGDLRARCPVPGCNYVGGHGNETDTGAPAMLRAAEVRRDLAALAAGLRRRMAEWPGARLDAKPYSIAMHFRQAPQWAEPIREVFSALAAGGPYRVMLGRQLVELLPSGGSNKGQAVHRLRARLGCDLAFYFGDDTTDEDVFAYPDEHLIGVKVENPETTRATAADYRLPGCAAMPAALDALLATAGPARAEEKPVILSDSAVG